MAQLTRTVLLLLAIVPVSLWAEEGPDDEAAVAVSATLDHIRNSIPVEQLTTLQAAKRYAEGVAAKFKPQKEILNLVPGAFLLPVLQARAELYATHLLEAGYAEWTQTGKVPKWLIEKASFLTLAIPEATIENGIPSEHDKFNPLKFHTFQRYYDSIFTSLFQEWTAYLADSRESLESIELVKFDEKAPLSLEHLILWYKALGFKVILRTVPANDVAGAVEKLARTNQADMVRLIEEGGEDPGKPQHQISPSLHTRTEQAWQEAQLYVRHQLGLLRGISLTEFNRASAARTPFEKVTELGIATATAATISIALHQSLSNRQINGELINAWLPVIVSVADKMFYGYYQRPVSAFFGQGQSVQFHQADKNGFHKFDKNRISFLLLVLANSYIIRTTMLVATNTFFDLHTYTIASLVTGALLLESFGSSLRGVYSKIPLQFLIEKYRGIWDRQFPMRVLVGLSAFNILWGIVQLGDLYKWTWDIGVLGSSIHVDLRHIMTSFAVIGLSVDTYLNRSYFRFLWKKVIDRVTHQPSRCEAWLSFHKTP